MAGEFWLSDGQWARLQPLLPNKPREVFEALAAAGGPPAEVLIDSTHVKAHRSAAGGKGGRTPRRSASAEADATPKSMPSPTGKADRSPSC